MEILAYIGIFIICMIVCCILDQADFDQKYDARKRKEEEEQKKKEEQEEEEK